MKKQATYIILSVFALFCATGTASAQFSINRSDDAAVDRKDGLVPLTDVTIDKKYFDEPTWRAEQRRIRKEKNTIEFNVALETSLQQFENWTGSGTNNFYILSSLFFRHQYKNNGFSADYRVDAHYGMNYIDNVLFKNKDEFKISGQMGWAFHKKWSYSASANIRSQFAYGFLSREHPDSLVSAFLSPGYIDVAVGFTYGTKDSPFKVTLSPVGGNIVTVLDSDVSALGKYGVQAGKHFDGKIGPSVDMYFDKTFGKKEFFRYRSNFYIFSPYRDIANPLIRWENTCEFRWTKLLSTTLYGQLYYRKEDSTAVQYQYSFMIGLKYVFRNK